MTRIHFWAGNVATWWRRFWAKYGFIGKRDLYRAAALSGLLARGGVMGGPDVNPELKEWADLWAERMLNENSA